MSTSSTHSVQQHTPGPWRARSRDVAAPEESEFLGWEIEGPPDAVRGQFARGADARLIAAAPELLAAAQMLIDWANGTIQGSVQAPVFAARKAISKAEGIDQ